MGALASEAGSARASHERALTLVRWGLAWAVGAVVAAIGAGLAFTWRAPSVFYCASTLAWSVAFGWPLYRNSLHKSRGRRWLESFSWVLILVLWTWVFARHFTAAPAPVNENWTLNTGRSIHTAAPPPDAIFVLGGLFACGVMCGFASSLLAPEKPPSFLFPVLVGLAFPFSAVGIVVFAPVVADLMARGKDQVGDTMLVLLGLFGGVMIVGLLIGALIEFGRRRLFSDQEDEVVSDS